MEIKTLAQILAESNSDSATAFADKKNKQKKYSNTRVKDATKRQNFTEQTAQQKKPNVNKKDSHLSDSKAIDGSFNQQAFTKNTSSNKNPRSKKSGKKKRFHPAANYTPQPFDNTTGATVKNAMVAKPTKPSEDNQPSVKSTLAALKPASSLEDKHSDDINDNNNSNDTDHANCDTQQNLPEALKVYLLSDEERHAQKEAIKAESRLRWLAFYYLSRREHAKEELRQKLLDKDQDPQKVEALLQEFAEKGYQSEWRTAMMLIRENIRKGRGRRRIKQEFYKRKLDMPSNIDELIDMAQQESDEFADFVTPNQYPTAITDGDDSYSDAQNASVDWLQLAVQARVKKYGHHIPTTPKDKAKQLRFLQYRGFKTEVCFEALKHNLESLTDNH